MCVSWEFLEETYLYIDATDLTTQLKNGDKWETEKDRTWEYENNYLVYWLIEQNAKIIIP